MEESRKGGEAVRATQTVGREGTGAVEGQTARQGRAPESGLQKQRGQTEYVLTASGT